MDADRNGIICVHPRPSAVPSFWSSASSVVNNFPKKQMLTRRQFHRRAAAAAAATFASPLVAEEPAKHYPPGTFFDFHTHIGRSTNYVEPLTAEALLRWMDAHDVAQAAVLPLASPESSAYYVTPDFVLEQTRPYRDRLIPFCSIDPRTDYAGGRRGLLGILSRWVEAGAKGFGEHKTGLAIDDPLNKKVYDVCAELKLPVLIHMDNHRNSDQPGLPGLARVLEEFPTVNFLGHAFGWWSNISGGITTADMGASSRGRPVVPGGAIDRLMDKYPNLYGDLSATGGAEAISRDLKFGREFLLRRADRLVFGSDYFSPGQKVLQFEL
jgi:predicted TIM-barrel fold metal-dependent hydrolase